MNLLAYTKYGDRAASARQRYRHQFRHRRSRRERFSRLNAAERAAAIAILAGDSGLRLAMGAAGRRKIERAYSLTVHGPRLARMLHEVMEEGRQRRASNRGGR